MERPSRVLYPEFTIMRRAAASNPDEADHFEPVDLSLV
jgi:hypothetical protein